MEKYWIGNQEQWSTAEKTVVDPERLELPTPAFEAQCSIQLSYGSRNSIYEYFTLQVTFQTCKLLYACLGTIHVVG